MNDVRPVVLCGFMGSGKSTVGRRVARALGRPFFDTDDVVEQRMGRSIPEAFADGDEQLFRETEATVVLDLLRDPPGSVISLGGGALERPATLDAVLGSATAVYLDRPLAAILATLDRLRQHRPLLAGRSPAEVAALYAARADTYRRCPVRIDIGAREVEDVTASVLEALRAVGSLPATQ